MASVRTERVAMSPQDQGAMERRIGRAYQDGVPMRDMEKRFAMSEGTITGIVRTRFPHIPIRGAKKVGKRKAGAPHG